MSDGPHRSLQMRKAWKELARRGDNKVYGADEVRDAALYALSSDFKSEVSAPLLRAIRNVFEGVGNSLLMRDVGLAALAQARHLAAGSVFGTAALRWGEEYINAGKFGRDNFYEALGCSIQERGYAGQKQVQEHYLRESHARRADSVACRIGVAMDGLNHRDVGRSFSGDGERVAAPRKLVELDQGAPI